MDPAQMQEMLDSLPKRRGFWQTHLGTDMLVASWMFVFFSIEYCVLCGMYLIDGYDAYTADDEMDWSSKMVYYYCAVVASIGYVIGSIFFVKFSYPESFALMFELDQAKVDTMSFTEKYFTGTAFLKGIWFFYIASVPFLVSSFYTIIHQPEEAAGYYQLFFTCFMFAGMGIWLIACMPQNMIANNGLGSSISLDNFFVKCCCCCVECLKVHCSSDFLVGAWFFCIISFLGGFAFLVEIFEKPSDPIPWLWFTTMIGFGIGSYLFVYTSYPENMFPPTTVFWDKCLAWCCAQDKDNEVDAEVGNVNEDKLPAEVTPLISIEDPKNI